MENKDILLFAGPLIGVIVGGVITSLAKWIELHHQKNVEVRRWRAARLEDLHDLLREFCSGITKYGRDITLLTLSSVEGRDAQFRIGEHAMIFSGKLQEIGFRLRVDSPELVPKWNNAMALMDEATQFSTTFVAVNRSNPNDGIRLETFKTFQVRLTKVAVPILEIENGVVAKLVETQKESRFSFGT